MKYTSNRARNAYYGVRQRDNLKNEMIAAYGGCCKNCGITDPIVLTLDHINDDAFVEIEKYGKNKRGGIVHYARLKKEGWPSDRFQLLCFNCNARKENERRRKAALETIGSFTDRVDGRKFRGGMRVGSNNTSGIKGVFWDTQKNKWAARIMFEYKTIHLGFFTDIGDAARAYAVKARELWGEAAVVATEEEIEAARNRVPETIVATVNSEDLGL